MRAEASAGFASDGVAIELSAETSVDRVLASALARCSTAFVTACFAATFGVISCALSVDAAACSEATTEVLSAIGTAGNAGSNGVSPAYSGRDSRPIDCAAISSKRRGDVGISAGVTLGLMPEAMDGEPDISGGNAREIPSNREIGFVTDAGVPSGLLKPEGRRLVPNASISARLTSSS